MSVIYLFVMAVWICFEPMWPKETASISVFHKSIQLFDAPCYSCNISNKIVLLIHHDYHCGDAPWSVHLLIVLEQFSIYLLQRLWWLKYTCYLACCMSTLCNFGKFGISTVYCLCCLCCYSVRRHSLENMNIWFSSSFILPENLFLL